MPIETGTTIADLSEDWPLGGDPVLEGDNHLRLIKSVLKTQFPGDLGDGLNIPIIATEVEFNFLSGLSGNIQGQLDSITNDDSLIAPAGTVLSFYQVAPPTGWTQLVTENDAMLRVVSGAGGGSGGTGSPTEGSFEHTHTTGDHILTEDEMPSHDHTYEGFTQTGGGSGPSLNQGAITTTTGLRGGDSPHNHGITGVGTLVFTPKYIDMIIAVKD